MLEQDTVLHGLVPPLDLALGLWVVWRASDMVHVFVLKIVGQVARDVRRAVVAEQPWFGDHGRAVAARGFQRQVERSGHILGFHRGAELPGDDVPAIVIQYGAEVEPAPAEDLQIGKVGLPQLIGARGFVPEFIGCLHHDVRWCRDQVFRLQDTVN